MDIQTTTLVLVGVGILLGYIAVHIILEKIEHLHEDLRDVMKSTGRN